MRDSNGPCAGATVCATDTRHEAVVLDGTLGGIDYVEVTGDGTTLCVRLFGKVPTALGRANVRVVGGERITGIVVRDATIALDADGGSCLHVTLDRRGDFSAYCLELVESTDVFTRCSHDPLPVPPLVGRVPAGVDPRYASATFYFRLDCPSPLDCRPIPCPPVARPDSPLIDYTARDYPSIRQLLLDRLAVTRPDWKERHAADLSMTLLELLAYRADQLHYRLDAVATEAYLGTARLRISVRRHARLLDYRLHEGCNARAWVTVATDGVFEIALDDLVLAAPPAVGNARPPGFVPFAMLSLLSGVTWFEPMAVDGTFRMTAAGPTVRLVPAHSEILFYTWGGHDCCLAAGAVRATLVDDGPGGDGQRIRVLELVAGNYLLLEEVRGAATGLPADADPRKRHVVRLTRVEQTVDPLTGTLLLEVEWDTRDALPFALCLTAQTPPLTLAERALVVAHPDAVRRECLEMVIAVARGNLVLVDHGRTTLEEDPSWVVGRDALTGCCGCSELDPKTGVYAGSAPDLVVTPATFQITLQQSPVTFRAPLPAQTVAALSLCQQDPHLAFAQAALDAAPADPITGAAEPWPGTYDWTGVSDLLDSGPLDAHFVIEVDDDGRAHLRFGRNGSGETPPAGARFRARYRAGCGLAGNVGAESIVWLARRSGEVNGLRALPRNPLAARGGIDPEPTANAKLHAPVAFGRVLERAITATDYRDTAANDPRLDGASAVLEWTGGWYEATVALDPLARAASDPTLVPDARRRLHRARRLGHDLRIVPARRAPLEIALLVCAADGYSRSDVERAVLDVLSTHRLADGTLGFFHPDRLEFGVDVAASQIVAAVQPLDGVRHTELLLFARFGSSSAEAARTLSNGVIEIASDEIAQLDNDPDFPERGVIGLLMRGGQ
jgi:hypothetical protein